MTIQLAIYDIISESEQNMVSTYKVHIIRKYIKKILIINMNICLSYVLNIQAIMMMSVSVNECESKVIDIRTIVEI